MPSTLTRTMMLMVAVLVMHVATGEAQVATAAWLDEQAPASWNSPGRKVPAAPASDDAVNPRCGEQARPPQSAEDEQVRARGWDLVGPFQGGWQVVVVSGAAGYDGMCRPLQYQDFVFVGGTFAGTLAPAPMDSRTDGALSRVWLQGPTALSAEYLRYDASDALCCASRTTHVTFEIAEGPVLRPVSTSTTANVPPSGAGQSAAPVPDGLADTSWQLVAFEGGDGTTLTPDDRARYTISLAADGTLTARIDCNRGRGTWTSSGSGQIALGPLALTRAMCAEGSMHNQIVRQWGNITSYVIRDGHLFLALKADGGIYELEPAPTPR